MVGGHPPSAMNKARQNLGQDCSYRPSHRHLYASFLECRPENLINFDQQKHQYVSWQHSPQALDSRIEGPREGIPKDKLTIGERAQETEASVRYLPPYHYGVGVPSRYARRYPSRPERTCKSPGARTDSKGDPVWQADVSYLRRGSLLCVRRSNWSAPWRPSGRRRSPVCK